MTISAKYWMLLPLAGMLSAAVVVAVHSPATAEPNPCVAGYMPRLASPNDTVFVTPAVASRTQQENANAAKYWVDGGLASRVRRYGVEISLRIRCFPTIWVRSWCRPRS